MRKWLILLLAINVFAYLSDNYDGDWDATSRIKHNIKNAIQGGTEPGVFKDSIKVISGGSTVFKVDESGNATIAGKVISDTLRLIAGSGANDTVIAYPTEGKLMVKTTSGIQTYIDLGMTGIFRGGIFNNGNGAGMDVTSNHVLLRALGGYDIEFDADATNEEIKIGDVGTAGEFVSIDQFGNVDMPRKLTVSELKPGFYYSELFQAATSFASSAASGNNFKIYGTFTGTTDDTLHLDSLSMVYKTNQNDVYINALTIYKGYTRSGDESTVQLFTDGTNVGAGDTDYHVETYVLNFDVRSDWRIIVKCDVATSGTAGNGYGYSAKCYGKY